MVGPEVFVGAGVALATGLAGSGLTYISLRRKSSGQINTSEAADLWAATKDFQTTMTLEIDKLRAETIKLSTDYKSMEARAIDCERRSEEMRIRLQRVEVEADAAKLIEAAKVEAAKIRAEAALERERFVQEIKDARDSQEGAGGDKA